RGADRPRPRSALHRRRRRPPPTRPTGHVPRTFTSPVPPAHSASRVYWSTAWTALIRTSGTTARPSDLQLGDVVGGEVAVPGGLDGLAGGVRAVDDHGHGGDVRTGLAERLAGGEHAAAGGGGVLDRDHATAGDVRSLDAALQPV